MNRSIALAAAVLITCVTFSTTCLAETADHADRLVRLDDLDLATRSGAAELNRRLDQAANEVCLDVTGPSPAAKVDAKCKSDAVKNARAQLETASNRRSVLLARAHD